MVKVNEVNALAFVEVAQVENVAEYMQAVGREAQKAGRILTGADTQQKNLALFEVYQALEAARETILAANGRDVECAKANGLDSALLDRLVLTEARFLGMLEGLKQVIDLPDPVGEISEMTYRPSGIQLGKMRVPLGVIGMIYESRPNVTLEAAALALKSGNAIILRGGSEAFFSNQAIALCIHQGLAKAGLPESCVQVIKTTSRDAVGALITLSEFVDVIIPRGGKGLVDRISNEAKIPVIKHLDGNCHTFVEKSADLQMATQICVNAKTQRYGTCNTMETLLIESAILVHLPHILTAMVEADSAMQFRVCDRAMAVLADDQVLKGHLSPASDEDWSSEYLAPILAVKVVEDVPEAIDHINRYGSHHTDVIVTNDYTLAHVFLRQVDSSSVMVNASSRFADGFEYGLGAEIGISTDKIHARGPVGLLGLTSQKWVVFGHGEVRR